MRALGVAAVILACAAGVARAADDAAGKALKQAEEELSALERLKAQADAEAPADLTEEQKKCRSGFDVDAAIRGVAEQAKEGKLQQDMRYEMLGFHSLCYYQCVAFAANDTAKCSPLNFFKIGTENPTGDGHFDKGDIACRDHIDDVVVTKALITRAPELQGLCLRNLTQRQVAPEAAAQVCRVILDHQDDPATLCREVRKVRMKLRLVGDDRKCEPLFKGINGDSEACRLLSPDTHTYERCFEYAAFYKAWHAGDITLCGDFPLCRVMMGGGGANCAEYTEHLETMLCGATDHRQTLLHRLAARRRDVLAELDAAKKALPSGDARGKKIGALRARCEKLTGA